MSFTELLTEHVASLRKILSAKRYGEKIFRLHFEADPKLFLEHLPQMEKLNLNAEVPLERRIIALLRQCVRMHANGRMPHIIRNFPFQRIFEQHGYFVCVTDDKLHTLCIPTAKASQTVQNILHTINRLFADVFEAHATATYADADMVSNLERRLNAATHFYLDTHGAWIERFCSGLADELSQQSFCHFLQQRISKQVQWNTVTGYPISPPPQSLCWRNARQSADLPLPKLAYGNPLSFEVFLRHSFIYEQYAIPDLVEARPGDCVIDAGAFIGDTTLYFAEKVGPQGYVYAFEAMPASAEDAKGNLALNGYTNAEVVNMALASECKILRFASTAPISNAYCHDDGDVAVKAMTLDAFVVDRGLKINFLKMDIEGAEIDALHGAQKTILRDRPTCAIALYHRQSDFKDIPVLLQKLCPSYVFYFRCEAEPVLFAIQGTTH